LRDRPRVRRGRPRRVHRGQDDRVPRRVTAAATSLLDVEEFRTELRRFLTEHHPGKPPKGEAERLAHARAWAATLADHGFAAPAWPARWGGLELPLSHQLAYHEEITQARVPAHPSSMSFVVAPTILLHG